uniref:Uncharacterized protein n=1 Tax=Arundo donax TaxID=35708 RepID=A0A0A9DJ94_ARUDO
MVSSKNTPWPLDAKKIDQEAS